MEHDVAAEKERFLFMFRERMSKAFSKNIVMSVMPIHILTKVHLKVCRFFLQRLIRGISCGGFSAII